MNGEITQNPNSGEARHATHQGSRPVEDIHLDLPSASDAQLEVSRESARSARVQNTPMLEAPFKSSRVRAREYR